MKPYCKLGEFKSKPADESSGITALRKLILKNANRSLKKYIRQKVKKELYYYLLRR